MKTATLSLALLGLLGAAACGNAGGSSAAAAAGTPSAQPGQGGQRPPGVSGLVAAIDGTTLQVQDTSSQTAVVYTPTTAITATLPATSNDVVVGTCAVVRSAAAGAAPAAAVTATSVLLSAPVSGSCAPGADGGGPGGPGGPGGMRPSGAPRRTPPSGAPGAGRGGGGAAGEITTVTAHGFTIAGTQFAGQGASTSPTTTPLAVTTTATTTYTKQQKATSAALKTGVCVTARGAADSAGTVTATSLAVRPAVNGSCTSGFGPRNG